MKCGLSAKAAETERTSISIASNAAIANRRIVVLLSKYNANTVKKCAHAHCWLFHTLRGFYPKGTISCTSRPYPEGIVSSTTQDILHLMLWGLLAAYPNHNSTINLCFCQAYFRLFEALLLPISRNTDSCFCRTHFRHFAKLLQRGSSYSRLCNSPV